MAASPNWYLSGGGGNSNPNASLGGQVSATLASPTLFDDVSADEAGAGDVEYRCVYVRNDGTTTAFFTKIWITSGTPDPDTSVSIGLAPEGLNGVAEIVANENTPPVAVVFSSPITKPAGLSLGDLAPGDIYPVWVRRTVNALAGPYNNDTFTVRVEGDTSL